MFAQKKIKYVILIFSVLFVVLVVLIICNSYSNFVAQVKQPKIKQAQISPSNTVKALLDALVRNDEYILNAIVVPEQQDEVTKWLANHKPFHCTNLNALVRSFPDIPDANFNPKPQIIIVDEQPGQDANTVYINALYSCLLDQSALGGLNFQVYEIVIDKRDSRWYIKSWDNVCESKSVAGCM